MEYRRPLGQGEVLVSSWLREGPLVKDARYRCVAEASAGNDMSEVDLHLTVGGIWSCKGSVCGTGDLSNACRAVSGCRSRDGRLRWSIHVRCSLFDR